MDKKLLIAWQANDYIYKKKTADWYWFLYLIFLSAAGISFYFFQDWIFGTLILLILIILTIISNKKPILRKYGITNTGFLLNNGQKNIDFENIESYFIDENNNKILINTKNKYQTLILIPFGENQNMDKADDFLEKKIKKNEKLKIPFLELITLRFLGF